MDDFAAARNAPVLLGAGARSDSAAGRGDDLLESLLHVPGLLDLVLAPLEVKAQHGNAPLVHCVWIDFAIAVRVRNHLAAPGETHVGAIHLAQIVLEARAVTASQYELRTAQDAGPRHAPATADFVVE